MRDAILRSQTDSRLYVRKVAELWTAKLVDRDYLSEALAFVHGVERNCRYFRDPRTVELVKSPTLVAEQILDGEIPQLDCDDMGAFIGSLSSSSGAKVRIACGAFQHAFYNGERQYSHTWPEVEEPRTQKWIVCDAVAGPKTKQMLSRLVAVRYWLVA